MADQPFQAAFEKIINEWRVLCKEQPTLAASLPDRFTNTMFYYSQRHVEDSRLPWDVKKGDLG